MSAVRLACMAMATRFELVLEGDDAAHLRAAGEEALAGIQRLEAKLSFFRPTSDVGRVNAGAAERPVRVDAEVFELLIRAERFHRETGGAFDVTVGPLMRCWRFGREPAAVPEPGLLAQARGVVGMHRVELDPGARTVRFGRPGVLIDLGAIGKGYAIEQAVATLRELGVEDALLHGGTSTVQAIGRPVAGGSWKVAVAYPGSRPDGGVDDLLATVELRDQALSVSAGAGRSFTVDGVDYGHVLDPRSGWPAQGAALAAVVSPSATEADALSTALLTLGLAGHGVLTRARPELPVLVLGRPRRDETDAAFRAVGRGIEARPSARLAAMEELR